MLIKTVSFAAAPPDQISVDSLLEISFRDRKEYLRGGQGGINIQHPKRKKVERVDLRTTLFEKPADYTGAA
ncbi:hypothetical protein ASG33_00245 [Dyadobacter sp. Leaf189]|nr:hypothetical protein ASG33_00245 [Dyadobacter sp. Leaf189]